MNRIRVLVFKNLILKINIALEMLLQHRFKFEQELDYFYIRFDSAQSFILYKTLLMN